MIAELPMGSVIKRYKMPIICLTPSSWTVGVCVLFYFYGSREALQEGKGGKERRGGKALQELKESPTYCGQGFPDQRGEAVIADLGVRTECSGNEV